MGCIGSDVMKVTFTYKIREDDGSNELVTKTIDLNQVNQVEDIGDTVLLTYKTKRNENFNSHTCRYYCISVDIHPE